MSQRRRLIYGGLLALVLLGFAADGLRRAWSAYHAAQRVNADLLETRSMAEQIRRLRQAPQVIGERPIELGEFAALIETAAETAGIEQPQIARILHEPAQRIEDTPYRRKDAQVLLNAVSLTAATRFLTAITRAEPGVNVTGIRLSAPRRQSQSGAWNGEFTLSYLIYQPTTARPSP